MSSSSFYKVQILRGAHPIFSRRIDAFEVPFTTPVAGTVQWDHALRLIVEREATDSALRVELGNEVVGHIDPGATDLHRHLGRPFRNELGESCLLLREVPPEEDPTGAAGREVARIRFQVQAREAVERDFGVMIRDLQQVHEGLARDVLSRGKISMGTDSATTSVLNPETALRTLESILERLREAVDDIARQPSTALVTSGARQWYRPGDRVDTRTVDSALRSGHSQFDRQGRLEKPGKVRIRRTVKSLDIPEHRLIAAGIRSLSRKARAVADHCSRMAQLIAQEKENWGEAGPEEESVFEQRDLPRMKVLRRQEEEALELAESFRRLLKRRQFLEQAAPPRRPFRSTPLFHGRTAYRRAYQALREARTEVGVLVDGDSVKLRYRSLPELYEYWCYIKTVSLLKETLGSPEAHGTFELIDEVYRPELKPGQRFLFRSPSHPTVEVVYNPSIPPWEQAVAQGEELGATLTRRPLRPDILISVRREGEPPHCLALDAKSTENFQAVEKWREMSDYSRQIFHVGSGTQPVRWVLLLHRDRDSGPITNLPPSYESPASGDGPVLIGGIPCIPEKLGAAPTHLLRAVRAFLGREGVPVGG